MPTAHDISGHVFKQSTARFLARVVDADGWPILRSDLAAIQYSVSLLDDNAPDAEQPVSGHQDQPLDIAATVFDTLQLDATWTADAQGYNFRHDLQIADHPAFAFAGLTYRVRYELTPNVGAPIVVRFRLRCI